ncbi:MAG: hypothetical protein AAF438_04545 [Pseudomonadota bacterium]
MYFLKATTFFVLLVMCSPLSANDDGNRSTEHEVSKFMNNYLGVYNRRFGHPDRSQQFRNELGKLVVMPFLMAPPMGKPQVPESLDVFTANFESFVTMLEGKQVVRLEWAQEEYKVLTPNKVLANNIGQGLTEDGEVAYETVSLYLLYREQDGWRIAMFSPYLVENTLSLVSKQQ